MIKRSSSTWLLLFRKINLTKLLLILLNIVVQSHKKTLSVLRSHNYAATNLRLLHARKHTCKVEDKVARRVSNKCEVSVNAYSDFRLQSYLKSLGPWVGVCCNFI